MREKKDKSATINTLLDCGLTLFGKYGYSSVTTKQVAEYTGLNSALVSYYFGGKREYYAEVIRHVTDMIVQRFADIDATSLEDKTTVELEILLKAEIENFYEWFTSTEGASGTNIFFMEIISQQHPEVQQQFERAINAITPYFIKLLTVYYAKTGRSHINPIFVWIMLISVTQNVSLHNRAPEEAKAAFAAAEIPKNMLNLILTMA